jgi:YfiH family protein
MIRQEHNNLVYYSYNLFEPFSSMSSVVSTRLGGVSGGPFHSLNLALSVGDDPDSVFTNRARLYEAVGIGKETVAVAQLVQGTHIGIVTDQMQEEGAQAFVATDGLITNIPQRSLMILIADCAPVTLYDPKHHAVGLAHGGWRGTVGRIVEKMIVMMGQTFESNPADILAAIGPSIGPCCYEVRQDLVNKFYEAFPQQAQHFFVPQANEAIHLDMWAALRYQLVASGVLPEHIEESGLCTACHLDEFYSNRAEKGRTGRFAGLVTLQ